MNTLFDHPLVVVIYLPIQVLEGFGIPNLYSELEEN